MPKHHGAETVQGHLHEVKLPFAGKESKGFTLPPAWHLILFPPRVLEENISEDGYDVGPFSPPAPFVHRKWAAGEFRWPKGAPNLRVGDKVSQVSLADKIEKKSKKGSTDPKDDMVFVWQKKTITIEGQENPSVIEKRCHVFTASDPSGEKGPKKRIAEPHRSFDVEVSPSIPTMVSLFRYSALTFNAHKIHLDNDFARRVEGQDGALVHGPLTATMLAEFAARVFSAASSNVGLDVKKLNHSDLVSNMDPFFLFENLFSNAHACGPLTFFSYRATSPLVVGRRVILRAKILSDAEVDVWAVDADADCNVVMLGTGKRGD
ncbi:hypothetical protein HDU97_006134 [Phlyctochytrium planicorne]|nr:hypothetical protein HDU97_006134 [Phlyctochytrium planicorne]